MSILADRVEHVIGVDTHKQTHTAAVVQKHGGIRDLRSFPSESAGYRAALKWANELAPGCRAWAVEGAGSYGAGLVDYLREKGELVLEVDRPKRPARKAGVKSDDVDAVKAARDALAAKNVAEPRLRGEVEAIRVLKCTRKAAVNVHSEAVVQLKALVVKAPESLRTKLRGLPTAELITTCAAMRNHTKQSAEVSATVMALRATARRAQAASAEVAELESQMAVLVKAQAPAELLEEIGVGVVVAAELLCAWSHPERLHSEAAFARLAGVAPVEASSGQVVRHRLSRSGDRQLNSALHTVVLTRWRRDERTQAYIARCRAQGKSDREIRRSLKRYVARHLFRILEHAA